MDLLIRLFTSNVVLGTSRVNSCIMTLAMVQILVTMCVFGLSSVTLFSVLWWPLCDAFLVLVNGCLRMDFLLREQLEGQESYIARIRKGLVIVVAVRFVVTLCVWAYKPLLTCEPLEFFVLTVSVIIFHACACIPTIRYLYLGEDLMENRRPESQDPLLEPTERAQISEEEDVGPYDSSNDSNYVSPFPQDFKQDIPLPSENSHNGNTPLSSRILQNALEENERSEIRLQQDLEYDKMISEQNQKIELANQNVIEPVEVKCAPPSEPDSDDPFAVEMRLITPNGTPLTRRFDRKDTFSVVVEWTRGRLREMKIPHENGVRFCERFPRKVYASEEFGRSLESLNFWCEEKPAPQRSSVLILELVQ